jgi:hypothetical protein
MNRYGLIVVENKATGKFQVCGWVTDSEFVPITDYDTKAEALAAIEALEEKDNLLVSDSPMSTDN